MNYDEVESLSTDSVEILLIASLGMAMGSLNSMIDYGSSPKY